MSALEDLFIEIENHSVMRGHGSLLLKAKEELKRYQRLEKFALDFINGSTIDDYKEAFSGMKEYSYGYAGTVQAGEEGQP